MCLRVSSGFLEENVKLGHGSVGRHEWVLLEPVCRGVRIFEEFEAVLQGAQVKRQGDSTENVEGLWR